MQHKNIQYSLVLGYCVDNFCFKQWDTFEQ